MWLQRFNSKVHRAYSSRWICFWTKYQHPNKCIETRKLYFLYVHSGTFQSETIFLIHLSDNWSLAYNRFVFLQKIDYKMEETGLILFPDKIHVNESILLGTDRVNTTDLVNEGTVHLNIQVPALPPTNLDSNSVIRYYYMLVVRTFFFHFQIGCVLTNNLVHVSGYGGGACYGTDFKKIKIPITIGSYPLRDHPAPSAPPLSERTQIQSNSAPPVDSSDTTPDNRSSFCSDVPSYGTKFCLD